MTQEKQARASKKQQELLQFVTAFINEHKYGPSYREIMRSLDYKSVSTVAIHIDGLIAKGMLAKKDNSARSLEIAQVAPVVAVNEHKLWLQKKHQAWLKKAPSATDVQSVENAFALLGIELKQKDN